MNYYQGAHLLSFLGPAILLMFSLTFLAAWSFDRARTHVLYFAAAFLLYSVGVLSQVLHFPPDPGPSALVSIAFYAVAGVCIVEGLLRRSGLRTPGWFAAAVPALMVAATAWFFYAERNVLIRAYLQNFGFGLVFLCTAWWLRDLRRGPGIDRFLFWLVLLFGLHFFPRTMLSLGLRASDPVAAFQTAPFWYVLQLSLSLFGVVFGLTLLAATGFDLMTRLRQEGSTDPLTGLPNRRGFEEAGRPRLAVGRVGAVILLDLDEFKRINDGFGHAAGDAVLEGVADLLRDSLRPREVAARLGGEEFVVLLEERSLRDAQARAEQLRRAIEAARFAPLPPSRAVTASLGVARAAADEALWDLVARADGALYEAKRGGRNRTCVAEMAASRSDP